MLNSCSSMHVKSQSCIVLFDLLLQQLYGILGQPSYVQSSAHFTEFFPCNVGTRQGCILSPVLFSLFINKLIVDIKANCSNGIFITQDISDIFALLYADDTANCADTVFSLQQQLQRIEMFCNKTGMRVNLGKIKIVVFRNGGFLRSNEKWFYQGQRVETVASYK